MKQFFKAYAFTVLTFLYLASTGARHIILPRLHSNFIHYSTIRLIFDIILALHCLFIVICLLVLLKLFINRAKLKLLKSLVIIFFAVLAGLFLVGDLTEGDRLVSDQIARKILITDPGDEFVRNVSGAQDKKVPALDAWQGYAFDNKKGLMYSHLKLNKHVCGLAFNELSPQTVLLVEHGQTSLQGADEASFKCSCTGEFLFLYTADSRVVVYIKQRDEYRYLDSNKEAEVVWVP